MNPLHIHGYKKSVEKDKVRIGTLQCKQDESLLNIGSSRADQFIDTRGNGDETALPIFLVGNLDFHIIADERLLPELPEDAFRLTCINAGFYSIDIVESGNSFNNLSLKHQPADENTTGHEARET